MCEESEHNVPFFSKIFTELYNMLMFLNLSQLREGHIFPVADRKRTVNRENSGCCSLACLPTRLFVAKVQQTLIILYISKH